MKRKILIILTTILLISLLLLPASGANAISEPVTMYYGDFTLPSTYASYPMMGQWDMNCGPVTVEYTLDLSGAPNVAYDWNWDNGGIVTLISGGSGARMCGFLSDWENRFEQFPTYPDNDASQDLDDKFNLQRFPNPGAWDETMYDVDLTSGSPVLGTIGSNNNYGIWFDRDGVDQWQDDMWGMVNGGTYNTDGMYDVQLQFTKLNSSTGYAAARMFPSLTNSWDVSGYGIGTGFYTVWKPDGPHYYPTGISFTTDETKMGTMQVSVSGSSDGGTIIIKDLTVTGCLVLDEGMATGGGWFIPEPNNSHGLTLDGSKATFGFVAKQKRDKSTGQLEFQYKGDGLNLKSTSYDWVNVATTQAMFEGVGTINGEGAYKFRVRAFDGDKAGGQPDRFEIRIWMGSGSFDMPTYRADGDLGGGNIVVHKK